MSSLRVPFKTLAVLGAFLAITATGQLLWLTRALRGLVLSDAAGGPRSAEVAADHVLPRDVVIAVTLPLFACAVGASLVLSLVTRMRVHVLVRALEDVAQGNFKGRLPLPREPLLRVVQDTFAKTNEALDQLTRKLAFADAQRRRLFSDLTHELATPSAAILGLVDTLGRADLVPTDGARATLLATLEQEALRLARLVSDVRDLAMVEDPDVSFACEPADVATLVTEAVQRFRLVQPEGAIITVSARSAWASVDAMRIEQALVNLLRNAKRYAPPTGSIEVEVVPEGAWARLAVENTGALLPDEIFARLGERLFRGDPARTRQTGGLGLGLAIVRSIVHRHGGQVEFARGARGGLRVTVRVPACGAAAADEAAIAAPAPGVLRVHEGEGVGSGPW
jgi:two-component system, OmpR family, sensor histidine kinase BaeS